MTNTIDADTLRQWLEDDRPVTVLDVRRAADRREWAIPGSVHIDVYDALREGQPGALATAPLPLDRPVVTVCSAGRISRTAAAILAARGFEARSLEGGMQAWSAAWNVANVELADGNIEIIQVRRTGKGCLSYIVACDDECAIIDPSVPAAVYVELARQRGWTVRCVLETHIHADHLSRARELAALMRVPIMLPSTRRARFAFTALADDEAIRLGGATLRVRYTPGHTDESAAYLLNEVAVFTGDTLFTNGVGRPDLHADIEATRHRARALFQSLAGLRELPPDMLILPAHTSEPIPFDGRAIAVPLGEVSTWLSGWIASEPAFVERVTANLPPTPPNFARIVELNEAGEPPTGDPLDLEAGANRCAVR